MARPRMGVGATAPKATMASSRHPSRIVPAIPTDAMAMSIAGRVPNFRNAAVTARSGTAKRTDVRIWSRRQSRRPGTGEEAVERRALAHDLISALRRKLDLRL